MNKSIFFEVNSETDLNELVRLNNTVVKRIRILEAQRLLPTAEEVKGENENNDLSKNRKKDDIPNQEGKEN